MAFPKDSHCFVQSSRPDSVEKEHLMGRIWPCSFVEESNLGLSRDGRLLLQAGFCLILALRQSDSPITFPCSSNALTLQRTTAAPTLALNHDGAR
jgi:hypothetical protein